MAKRDKLYTVNRWNKPFFEEERKKLYAGGGDQNSTIPGLGSLDVYGLGNAGGIAPITPVIKPLYTQQENSNFDDYRGGYNPANRFTLYDVGVGTGGASQTSAPANFTNTDKKQEKDWLSKASDALHKTYDVAMGYKTVSSAANGLKNYTPIDFRRLTQHVTPKTTEALKLANVGTNTLNSANTIAGRSIPDIVDTSFNNAATKSAIKAKSAELAKQIGTHTATTPKIPSAGAQIGANLAGQFIGDAALNLIAPKMGEYTKVDDILGYARQATPLLNFIPGAQWWLPAVANAGLGLLSGLAKPLFGGYVEGKNEVLSDIARLNSINPNGSNEYLATLMANQPGVRHAKGHNSVFNKSPERDATKLNDAADYAESRFYRGIDNAIDNNNTIQLWHALNDYSTYGAMGGKLNRKKCNCKSYGGYLDSATPTGFNFLSDLTNIQMLKNQTNQDINSSIGNSFMSTPDMGSILANGGPINIKKSHRGRLTELKKRTGKTEAELYNDGNPAHKKMITFARNARKWRKAYGGFLDAANNLSEIEKTLYENGGTLETKDKDIRNNSFFNGASLYDLGGILQAGGSNWGNVSQTQTSMSNKGYNVGDVIEIDESEAELLKKLGYEYKIVG